MAFSLKPVSYHNSGPLAASAAGGGLVLLRRIVAGRPALQTLCVSCRAAARAPMDFQRLFHAAAMTVAALTVIRFPWETAGLASLVVPAQKHMPCRATCMQFFGAPPQTMQAQLPGTRVCDLHEVAAKRRRIMATTGEESRDYKRYVQVMWWLMILQLDPHASVGGVHILQGQNDRYAADKVLDVVTNALATESPVPSMGGPWFC